LAPSESAPVDQPHAGNWGSCGRQLRLSRTAEPFDSPPGVGPVWRAVTSLSDELPTRKPHEPIRAGNRSYNHSCRTNPLLGLQAQYGWRSPISRGHVTHLGRRMHHRYGVTRVARSAPLLGWREGCYAWCSAGDKYAVHSRHLVTISVPSHAGFGSDKRHPRSIEAQGGGAEQNI
jgi:hypothetical protein